MIPLIFISHNQNKTDKFLEEYINKHKFSPYSIFKIHPLKKEITIDQIREIKKQIITNPLVNRLFIIFEFGYSGAETQNALLKTLEEKTGQNQFIMLAQNEASILATITSRSKIVYLEEKKERAIDQNIASLLEKLGDGPGYVFLSDKTLNNLNTEKAISLLDQAIYFYRKYLTNNKKAAEIIKKAMQLKKLLRDNNLNPQLSIDNFLIFIKKILSP